MRTKYPMTNSSYHTTIARRELDSMLTLQLAIMRDGCVARMSYHQGRINSIKYGKRQDPNRSGKRVVN
eukprot:scaffold130175_cov30-Attheya_sp.AAC.1